MDQRKGSPFKGFQDAALRRYMKRTLIGFALTLFMGSTLFTVSTVEAAQAPMEPVSKSPFVLEATSEHLQNEANNLANQLPKSGIQKLLTNANRTAVRGCSSSALTGVSGVVDRWCFNSGDNNTPEWYPQGVSGTGDAQADDLWGTKRAIVTSWYHKGDKGSRVTFLDPATGKYRHVLLVEPYTNSYGNPSYRAVKIHAGGIVWYGNYLYVVDTRRGIRVFDMRYVFDLTESPKGDTSNKDLIGRRDGVYYGHGYRYVMAQIGAWTVPGKQAGASCEPSGPPRFGFIGLDRSPVPDTLITGEYCNPPEPKDDPTQYGRVARWPLDGQTGKLKTASDGRVYATEAYRAPSSNAQGVLALNGTWYLMTSAGSKNNGKLYKARPGAHPTYRKAAIGPEDLYYWPARDQIWTVAGYPGKRVLYAVRP